MPSGSDPLHWLAHAKALVSGVRYPLWSEGLLQYPPVPIVILGFFAKIFGDILGMKLFGAFVIGILPISSFVLFNKMFGSRVGLVASIFIAVTPAFYEMWGWGMFPNLFGFSVLLLSLFTVINFVEHKNLKWGIITSLMIILVMFSHHLTSIIFVAMILLWTVLCFFTKQRTKELAIAALFALAVFVLYRVIVPSQYELFNPNTALVLPMDYSKFLWVFKNIIIFAVSALTTVYGCYLIYRDKPIYSLMVISLIAASFGVTYGLPIVGIDLDQARFLIFSLFGFSIGVAYLVHDVVFKVKVELKAINAYVNAKSLVIIVLVIALIAVSGYIGISTSWKINGYTRANAAGIVTQNGDKDIQGLVDWIKNNTKEKDTFAADQYLSKIIMGLGERRVLEDDNLGFLFMQGESERAIAADTLLHTNYEVMNSSVRVRDQYPVQDQNPVIALYNQGIYYDTIYFAEGFWQVTVSKNGNEYTISPYLVQTSTMINPLSVSYESYDVIFKREIKIEENGVRLVFSAEPRGTDVKLSDMKIYGWRPWTNNNLKNIQFDGSTLTLVDGQVNAQVIIKNSTKMDYYLADPVYKQAGFLATYEPEGGTITGELFVPYKNNSQNTSLFLNIEKAIKKYVQLFIPHGNSNQNVPVNSNVKEIIQKYNVSYLAILNNVTSEVSFLDANGYKTVYKNALVTIYSTK